MKLTLAKTESSSLPPQLIGEVTKFENRIQGTIRNNENQLTSWFIMNVLRHRDNRVPRLEILNRADYLVRNNISNQKLINTLFLQQYSIVNLIQQSQSLIDIGFVMFKHSELKLKNKQYGEMILEAAMAKVQNLLRNNQNQLVQFYNLREVENFLQQKQRLPQSYYILQKYQKQQMQNQAMLIFNYIYKPLFQKKNLLKVYDCLYPIVMWFIVIRDDTADKQRTLMQMAKKINIFLWGKKSPDNIHLISTFNLVMNLLSAKYLQQDSFSFQTLAPLLIQIKNIPSYDLINNWMATQKKAKNFPKKIQNIFRNSLNSGCSVFCFGIIDVVSNHLLKQGDYETLFHIFDSFIRRQYLSIKLPNGGFVNAYMRILMLYAIGFINRDRLDGETQLDRLALNLQEVVCRPKFNYDQCHIQIIKFFRIYENRFHFLSNTCKKFVSTLQQTYRYQISIANIHQQVAQRIFNNYNANYDLDQIHSLQRSFRYAGLVNLGNTCYMNSFMQALFMTKKFKTLVIKAQDEGIVPANHPLFQSLVNLFSSLNSKTNQARTEVQPKFFKQQIPQPFKSSYQQHDSGEFGRMFLDSVSTQLKDTGLADKIDRLFTHELLSKIVCKGCRTERQMKEKVFDFILSVQQDSNQVISVSELMKNYFKGYELDENNKVMCNKCRADRPAFVMKQPIELAQHLIVTVSIFKFDRNGSSKIIKPLNFQFSLNFKNILPKIVENNEIYQLYAFILHIGTGVQRGHYQCFARNLQQNPMSWYKFDDHYVTEQQINQIEDFHFGENQTPYILFYSNTNKSRKIINNS